jgi:hypothetical protein
MRKFFELLGKKKRGKGAVSHSNVYNYSTVTSFGSYENVM